MIKTGTLLSVSIKVVDSLEGVCYYMTIKYSYIEIENNGMIREVQMRKNWEFCYLHLCFWA